MQGEGRHQLAVGVTHAHHGLVEIESRFVEAAELESLHHIVVCLLRVEVLSVALVCGKRRDAVGESLLDEVVAEVHVVLLSHGHRHIDRTHPVALCDELEHHEVALVEGVLAFQRDYHAVWNGVARHHHAALAHGVLVYRHIECVGRDEVAVLVAAALPVFQHVLEFERTVAPLCLCLLRILLIEVEHLLLGVWMHLDVFVGA